METKFMNSTVLERLNAEMERLSLSEQVWLLERLVRYIRERTNNRQTTEDQLEAMASDPAIQRELQLIENEFSSTDSDGLSNLP
jgi:hypothetical protein